MRRACRVRADSEPGEVLALCAAGAGGQERSGREATVGGVFQVCGRALTWQLRRLPDALNPQGLIGLLVSSHS